MGSYREQVRVSMTSAPLSTVLLLLSYLVEEVSCYIHICVIMLEILLVLATQRLYG